MARHKKWVISDEDLRLIKDCKMARIAYRQELKSMPKNRSRIRSLMGRAEQLHRDIYELENEQLAEKFELPPWVISRI